MNRVSFHLGATARPLALALMSALLVAFSFQTAAAKTAAQPAAKKAPAENTPALMPPPLVTRAVAHLRPTAGNKVAGTVEFTKLDKGIQITATVTGLAPGSQHGFHIHQIGDCSAPDGSSAGGHFASQGSMHSGPDAKRGKRHEGDLGNLVADTDGNAKYEHVDTIIALLGRQSILGRGVIVHADVDDLHTQPTGNAGSRVACGVIGVAK